MPAGLASRPALVACLPLLICGLRARGIVGGSLDASGFAISPSVGRLLASAYRRLGEFLGAFRTHRISSLLGGEKLNLEPKVKRDQPAIGSVSRRRALTSVRLRNCCRTSARPRKI